MSGTKILLDTNAIIALFDGNEIVKGLRGITVDTALRLSVFFGTDAQSWINLQTHYDTELARVAMAAVLGRIVRREAFTEA